MSTLLNLSIVIIIVLKGTLTVYRGSRPTSLWSLNASLLLLSCDPGTLSKKDTFGTPGSEEGRLRY